ncbi:hypothetical protein G6F21_014283 [Rhizopus arrhizus]|nr:hypothetical protein G6F21_014283 [Rhizopus arrhizus]
MAWIYWKRPASAGRFRLRGYCVASASAVRSRAAASSTVFCTPLARSSGWSIARDIARGTGGFSGFGAGGRWQPASSTVASRGEDRINMRMAALRGGRAGSVAPPAGSRRERVSLRHRNTAGAAPEDT